MKYRCAGIVLYNPDLIRLNENIKSILPQVDLLILIDNGSANVNKVIEKYNSEKKIKVIENHKNLGIASALNTICEIAKLENYEWVMLLDQDSICSATIIESYRKYINDSNVGLLTPFIIDINKISINDYKEMDLNDVDVVDWAISSASFINIVIWEKLGKFMDSLFIDGVDIDYSIRLKLNNYTQLRINDEYLLQEVGKAEKTWLKRIHRDNSGEIRFINYYRSNHSPIRQYYMAKNHIIISKKYKKYIPLWKSIVLSMLIIIPKLVFEKPKLKVIPKIIIGVLEGCFTKVAVYEKKRGLN